VARATVGPQHPDVKTVKLPFYDVHAELLKPISLLPQSSNRFQVRLQAISPSSISPSAISPSSISPSAVLPNSISWSCSSMSAILPSLISPNSISPTAKYFILSCHGEMGKIMIYHARGAAVAQR
jgi:hypothetical protein